ncbi:MAG: magnesium transporter [Candidatus Cloacimonetes bacterium 4572_55]|nr:MAG: magnesium transporter [Candidatus Cloacimonetes bacterium 4572_55]
MKIFLSTIEPVRIADALKFLSEEEKVIVINSLPLDSASVVLGETDEQSQEDIVEELESEKLGQLLDEMDSDDAVDILDDLEPDDQEEILAEIDKSSKGRADVLRDLLQYPEDTAGGIMAPELLTVYQCQTIGDALSLFKEANENDKIEDIHNIFVVDKHHILCGLLPLKSLIIYSNRKLVKDVMNSDYQYVPVEEDQEVVAHIVRKYDLYSIPVVDGDKKLVGRITADDILDVIDEEAIEDMSHIAGVTQEEFTEESVLRSVRNRVPWLLIGLFGGIVSATIINFFEDSLKLILALAFFVPVVTAMGGNAGVQSSAIIVKRLATGDIHPQYLLSRLSREIQIAFLNGLICSTFLTLIVTLWRGDFLFGFLIGLALFLVILIATVVGTSVPLILKSLDIDPAIAMGPFVTTSNDVVGLMLYLGIASLFIKFFY